MGIQGLTKLLEEYAPESIKDDQKKNFFSRKIALDGNMSLYQFMIGIRGSGMDLENSMGEITNHLSGILYRTTKMMELGLKPIYVFDGKPPTKKSGELKKRSAKVQEAKEDLKQAQKDGDVEKEIKLSKRTVRVTREQCQEAMKLLTLMGIPVIQAPSEAEAQCAQMCRDGLVWAVGTEDMDALTFGSPILLRYLTAAESLKKDIRQYDLKTILESLDLSMDQFIDMSILCGCDYTTSIRGIGPKKAYKFIQEHGNIENVVENVCKGKKGYEVPPGFLDELDEVRNLFKSPEILPSDQIKIQYKAPDEEGILKFMVEEKNFDRDRVKKVVQRLKDSRKKKAQNRLDNFFTVIGKQKTTKKKKSEPKRTKKQTGKRKRTEQSQPQKRKYKF